MRFPNLRFLLPCFLALPLSGISNAQDPETETLSAEREMERIAALGPGVHAIQKDKKGRILSCIVVGQSRISTVLGKSKGLEDARRRANLNVSAEFVKWLKEDVTVVESTQDEKVILIEGAEEGDEGVPKETGVAVERSGTKIDSISQGLVRGLQVIHLKTDGETKMLTVVKGWKADTSEGVKKVASDSKKDEPESAKSGTSRSDSETAKSKKADKQIPDSDTTSSDASDYLPKKKSK